MGRGWGCGRKGERGKILKIFPLSPLDPLFPINNWGVGGVHWASHFRLGGDVGENVIPRLDRGIREMRQGVKGKRRWIPCLHRG